MVAKWDFCLKSSCTGKHPKAENISNYIANTEKIQINRKGFLPGNCNCSDSGSGTNIIHMKVKSFPWLFLGLHSL